MNDSGTDLYVDKDPEPEDRNIKVDLTSAKAMEENTKKFCNNHIKTSKYTVLTFVPLNLLTQFSKMSNVYFLIISFMQTIKRISITNGTPV